MLGNRARWYPRSISLPRALTALDWIIVAFTVLMAIWGFGQGLIAGGLALAGSRRARSSDRGSGRWCWRKVRSLHTRLYPRSWVPC